MHDTLAWLIELQVYPGYGTQRVAFVCAVADVARYGQGLLGQLDSFSRLIELQAGSGHGAQLSAFESALADASGDSQGSLKKLNALLGLPE